MRKTLLLIAIVFTIAITGSAYAQPNIMVYFDEDMTLGAANCPPGPPGTVIDTLYVVANNFNMWISAAEFMIVYPPQLTVLGDNFDTPLVMGTTSTGVTIGWQSPKNCFGATVLAEVVVQWMCNDCVGNLDAPIDVVPNPSLGFLRAVQWPDTFTVNAIGMRSLICATTPVEETTWGQIKSLYH
jgi:hypothetical protein